MFATRSGEAHGLRNPVFRLTVDETRAMSTGNKQIVAKTCHKPPSPQTDRCNRQHRHRSDESIPVRLMLKQLDKCNGEKEQHPHNNSIRNPNGADLHTSTDFYDWAGTAKWPMSALPIVYDFGLRMEHGLRMNG
jgi:hypothetical protein